MRRLAVYYNDFVRPDDPYEFVGLLQEQPLLAAKRNHAIQGLADILADNDSLRRTLEATLKDPGGQRDWPSLCEKIRGVAGGEEFIEEFEDGPEPEVPRHRIRSDAITAGSATPATQSARVVPRWANGDGKAGELWACRGPRTAFVGSRRRAAAGRGAGDGRHRSPELEAAGR